MTANGFRPRLLLALGLITLSLTLNLWLIGGARPQPDGDRQELPAHVSDYALLAHLIDTRHADLLAFALTGDEMRMTRFDEKSRQIDEQIAAFLKISAEADQGDQSELRSLSAQYRSAAWQTASDIRAAQKNHAISNLSDLQMGALVERMNDLLNKLSQARFHLLRDRQMADEKSRKSRLMAFASFAALSAVLAAVLLSLTICSLVSSLSLLENLAESASASDLGVRDICVATSDEVGRAALALNLMKNNLRRTVLAVAGVARHLVAESRRVSTLLESRAATHKADDAVWDCLCNSVSALTEIREKMTAGTRPLLTFAPQASALAVRNERSFATMINYSHKLAGSFSAVLSQACLISHRGTDSAITECAEDLADQLNFLSINLSLEAARAEYRDNGLTILTDEVRRMSACFGDFVRKLEAADQTRQKQANDLLLAVNHCGERIKQNAERAEVAKENLKATNTLLTVASRSAEDLAECARQQNVEAEKIQSLWENWRHEARTPDVSSKDSLLQVANLSALALDLQNLMSVFKTEYTGTTLVLQNERPHTAVGRRPQLTSESGPAYA